MSSTGSNLSNSSEEKRWQLQERPFTSSVPVVGGLIVGFRNLWNSIAAKWYVRPIVHQQVIHNELIAELIDHLSEQQIIEDRERAEISHDIAEITVLLASLNRSLEELDERLSMLEKDTTAGKTSVSQPTAVND